MIDRIIDFRAKLLVFDLPIVDFFSSTISISHNSMLLAERFQNLIIFARIKFMNSKCRPPSGYEAFCDFRAQEMVECMIKFYF